MKHANNQYIVCLSHWKNKKKKNSGTIHCQNYEPETKQNIASWKLIKVNKFVWNKKRKSDCG